MMATVLRNEKHASIGPQNSAVVNSTLRTQFVLGKNPKSLAVKLKLRNAMLRRMPFREVKSHNRRVLGQSCGLPILESTLLDVAALFPEIMHRILN